MADDQQVVTSHISFIVTRNNNSEVLTLASEKGRRFPSSTYDSFDVEEQEYCEDLAKALHLDLGDFPVFSILYWAHYKFYVDPREATEWRVCVMESHVDELAVQENAKWIALDTLEKNTPMLEDTGGSLEVLRHLSNSNRHKESIYRVSWRRRGWFKTAIAGADMILMKKVGEGIIKVTQVKNRSHTYVLCLKTSRASYYFKASHPTNEEPAFTQWLAKHCPEYTLNVIAINADMNCMLMNDLTEAYTLKPDDEPGTVSAVYQSLGKIQLKLASLLKNRAVSSSVPLSKFLTPRRVATRLEPIISDSALLEYISPEDIMALKRCLPTWREICERLEDAGIPCSVVHRDLADDNYARSKGRELHYVIYDWGSGCISHPFLHIGMLRDTDGVNEEHVESYLSLWKRFVPDMDKLKTIETLAGIVASFVDVVEFYDCAKRSEASRQFFIVSPNSPDRIKDFQAVASRLQQMKDSVNFYLHELKPLLDSRK